MEAGTPKAAGETLLDGKLTVVRVLGAGGMGTVYEVRHELTKHHRALKVLHPRVANATIIKRFMQEAAVAGTLGSDYIVETFDAGQLEDGSFYVLMEMLEGEPLRDYLDRAGRLDPGHACAVIDEICEGLSVAHDSGIIHRDLKPENIFLVKTNNGVRIKILDFGISKFESADAASAGATETGAMLGTPLYMPPEQLKDTKNVDKRADIYSLGVMLYEMLAGARPFSGDSLPTLLVNIYTGEHPPLSERAPGTPADLVAITERAMHTDVAERFATTAALQQALRPFVTTTDLADTDASSRDVVASTGEIAFLPTAASEADPPPASTDEMAFLPTAAADAPARRTTPAWLIPLAVAVVVAGAAFTYVFRGDTPTEEIESTPELAHGLDDEPGTVETGSVETPTVEAVDPPSEVDAPNGVETPPEQIEPPTKVSMAAMSAMSGMQRPSEMDLESNPYP